eukprot:gi/632968359/ref/XP_007900483.1/ PREDICTED: GAS2-like protein 1 [Callorhinchus milii]
MADQTNIQSAASKSIRPFKSSEEYLYAMKEDLAEWLNTLYDLDIHVDLFMDKLETGYALCRHANNLNLMAGQFEARNPELASKVQIPRGEVIFTSKNVSPGSFVARDNVSNFISWCRGHLGIRDALMFETNDLVQRRNEKNVVLCLLEVARRGSKFGMLAPTLIQMEEEIEEEMMRASEAGQPPGHSRKPSAGPNTGTSTHSHPHTMSWGEGALQEPTAQRRLCDFKNLDAMVREILGYCSCPSQFPMTKVSEGKYKVGETSALIFIRVLRNHVMVRVGGGWDTLEHYLDKHDPCRCASFAHRLVPGKVSGSRTPRELLGAGGHGSRSSSPAPYRHSEGNVSLKPPESARLTEKRGSLVSDNRAEGCGGRGGERSYSPSNGGVRAEWTRGTPSANPAFRPESPDNGSRSTRSPTPSHPGRASVPRRPQDKTHGRRREPVGESQAGRREKPPVSALGWTKPRGEPAGNSRSRLEDQARRQKSESSERGSSPKQRPRVAATGGRLSKGKAGSGVAVLVINRGKEGRHSWARAGEGEEGRAQVDKRVTRGKSPTRPPTTTTTTTTTNCVYTAHFTSGGRPRPLEALGQNRSTTQRARGQRTPAGGQSVSSRSPWVNQNVSDGGAVDGENGLGLGYCQDPELEPDMERENGVSCRPLADAGEAEDASGSCQDPESEPDTERERELYRSFEEEFLANTRRALFEGDGEAEAEGAVQEGGLQVDEALKTVESISEPLLPSPVAEKRAYSVVPEQRGARDTVVTEDEEELVGYEDSVESTVETSSESSFNIRFPVSPGPHRTPTVVMRPKKSLRKPDRVPSIYKLKLRPKIRPRTDNRPERRPSKIPTPASVGLKIPRPPQEEEEE